MVHIPSVKLVSIALLCSGAALAGCANAPPERAAPARGEPAARVEPAAVPSRGEAVARLAMSMVGTHYRYGGSDPAEGFDCSGLVHYAYARAGRDVPRTSRDQFRAARKISLREAAAGDVMFFQDEEKLSHVGIYVGEGMFVHAPRRGERVSVASIDTPYYQQHLVAVGRLLSAD